MTAIFRLDWTPAQLAAVQVQAFTRTVKYSARYRQLYGETWEARYSCTALATVRPKPEVVTADYLPPGARGNRLHFVPETVYGATPGPAQPIVVHWHVPDHRKRAS